MSVLDGTKNGLKHAPVRELFHSLSFVSHT
jgi:hypothetical protein